MLQRHLAGTPVKIGIGANRANTAACFLKRYGHITPCKHGDSDFEKHFSDNKQGNCSYSDQIGVAILDDGMQVSKKDVEAIASEVRKVKNYLPIFLSRLMPLYFLKAGNMSCKLALMDIHNTLVLCVSAIGSADSFVERMKKLEPAYVDRLDFSDHHLFQAKDIDMIRLRLRNLQSEFAMKPVVVVTEKDYDRAPEVLKHLDPYEVLVLCSSLQILPHNGNTEDSFKKCLWQHLEVSNKV